MNHFHWNKKILHIDKNSQLLFLNNTINKDQNKETITTTTTKEQQHHHQQQQHQQQKQHLHHQQQEHQKNQNQNQKNQNQKQKQNTTTTITREKERDWGQILTEENAFMCFCWWREWQSIQGLPTHRRMVQEPPPSDHSSSLRSRFVFVSFDRREIEMDEVEDMRQISEYSIKKEENVGQSFEGMVQEIVPLSLAGVPCFSISYLALNRLRIYLQKRFSIRHPVPIKQPVRRVLLAMTISSVFYDVVSLKTPCFEFYHQIATGFISGTIFGLMIGARGKSIGWGVILSCVGYKLDRLFVDEEEDRDLHLPPFGAAVPPPEFPPPVPEGRGGSPF